MAEFDFEGLLGNAFGGGGGNALDEYLTPEQRRMMQRNAMLAASAALLKAGGESTRRIGIGEALGGAFEAGQAGYEKAQTGALTQMALKQKMEEAKRGKVAPIDPKEYTQESVQAYVASNNPGLLVPVAPKAASPFALLNPKDYTPDSLKVFLVSNQVSDLVPVAPPTKQTSNIGTVSPNDFTAASLAKFNVSGNYEDLVRVPDKPSGAVDRAPTLTTIVDPTNSNQMLSIDARRYSGGGVGSPGVLGVSGKEPGAATKQLKTETGKSQLADDLSNLRASFLSLDAMKSIPSTQRSSLSNIASGISASAIGQKTGQMFGTEAQVERDVINSARSRLVNSIKNATGMSAQQLNSNVELQTMLRSISDPGHSIQAALRIIDDIEKAYVTGSSMAPPAAAQGSRLTPAQQAELDKLRLRFGGQR